MDQWRLKMLPLLAVLLIFRRCAFGFPGGVYSKTHLHWGQASDSAFASRAVQSSQSESPVTGTFSVDEVGSNLITDRSQKSTSGFSNLRQYVKGGFSKSHETSRTQTGSVSAALAVPQDERQTSSLTSQPQVSSSSSVQNFGRQLASGPSLQNQYSSSSHGGSGLQSAGGFSQIVSHQREGSTSGLLSSPGVPSQYNPESHVKLSSSPQMVSSQARGDQSLYVSGAPRRSAMPLASSSHYVPVETGSSSRDHSSPEPQGNSAVYAPSSPQSVSIQSGSDQDFHWTVAPVGTQAGASSQFMSSQGGSSSYSGALSQPQSSPSKYSAGSPKPTSPQTFFRPLTSVASSHGSSGFPFGASSQSASQGMSSSFSGSMQSLATSSQYVPSSPTFSKFSSSRLVSSQSTSDPGLYSKVPSTSQIGSWPQSGVSSQFVPSQGGSNSYSGFSPQSLCSSSKYSFGAPKSTSPQTVSRPSDSVISSQGSSGAHFGAFSQLASQGMSSGISGSAQGTFSQPAHSSPTYSEFGATRQVYSQSKSDPGLYGQLSATSQFGSQPQKETSPQLSEAASGFNSGSLPQSRGSFGQYAPASPSKYVNALLASRGLASQGMSSGISGSAQGTFSQPALSSPTFSEFSSSRQAYSQSTSDPGLYGQLSATSQFGSQPQKETSPQLSEAASGFNSGSLPQSRGSLGQYAHASPSKYVNALLASRGLASQGMSSGISGSAQGTFSQPALSSPTFSEFSSSRQAYSQSTSDPGLYGQLSATSQFGSQPQKETSPQLSEAASGFNSGSLPQSRGSLGQYAPASPSKYVNALLASRGLASQGMSSGISGSAQGTFSQHALSSPTFSEFSSSRQAYSQSTSDPGLYGQLSATSQFGSQPQKETSPQLSEAASGFNSGSLPQSRGSLGQYAPASPSKYVNVPLASQGFATQSATGSSRRGLTSDFLGGSQSGSSLTLQGSGSSSMPQGTMSQFVSGSPSQYSSASLSSTQSIGGQYRPASQRVFTVSKSPQRLEPSASSWTQGIQSSGAAVSQGNYQSQSSQVHSRFSSPLSAGDSAYQSNPQALSRGSDQLVSSQEGSGSYWLSPSTSSRYPLGSPGYAKLLGSSHSTTGQSSSLYGSTPQTGSGSQLSSSRYASLQGGSNAVVGSSQYASGFSPLDAKAALYLSRPSAASLTQGIQTSKTASSQSTSSAQMSSGFSSSLSALSQNVAPVAQSGPMSAVWRSQSPLGEVERPSRLSSSFQAPSGSTTSSQMSERFTSHHPTDSSLPPSSGLSAQLSSTGMFSGSSLPKTAQTLSEYGSQSHNQEGTASVASNTPFLMFSGNYGQDASVSSKKKIDSSSG